MSMYRALTGCVALAFAAGACRGDDRGASTAAAVDTIGGTIVVTNPQRPAGAAQAVPARPDFVIGEQDGDPDYTFGAISSLAVDASKRLYVSDLMAADVRVYGPGGELIERIGREGHGPGEFQRPTGLAISDAGVLYVRDETRVQRFAPAAPGGVASRYVGSHPGPAYGSSLLASRVDSAGRLYYPRVAGRIPDRKHSYLVFDSAGSVIDTLPLPQSVRVPAETAVFRTGASGGRMIRGLARAPFAPVPSWDVTEEGHLLLADGRTYQIAELRADGDTLRVVRMEGEARAVPAKEYDDSLRAVRRRIAEAPAPVERLDGVAEEIRRGELPRTLPQILSVQLGADGRIWVRRWPAEGAGGSEYDVFTREGIYQQTVRFPASLASLPQPVFTADRAYGVALDPETEVQRVVAFELPRP